MSILILVLLFLLGNMHGYNKAIHLKNKDQSGQYEFVVALDKGGNEKVHTGKLNLIDLSNNFLILFDKQSEEVTIYNRNHILKTKKKW